MKIILTSVKKELADAWRKHCSSFPNVEVHEGSILELDTDAVVSPANSFGFMDGGLDYLYNNRFGPTVQDNLQQVIKDFHHGELLVGEAEIVETGDSKISFLIAAPTMRVPILLGNDSINAYLAARAVFCLIQFGVFRSGTYVNQYIRERVKTVVLPGLGTGIGGMKSETCAKQVGSAINDVLNGIGQFPSSVIDATSQHEDLIK